MNTMLEVNGLYKNFKELEVLRGVSLKIDEGEVVAVIGPTRMDYSKVLRAVRIAGTALGDL